MLYLQAMHSTSRYVLVESGGAALAALRLCVQGKVKAISGIAATDVVMYDCVGISVPHRGPVVGAAALQELVGGVLERCSPGGMVPLAVVAAPAGNQVREIVIHMPCVALWLASLMLHASLHCRDRAVLL